MRADNEKVKKNKPVTEAYLERAALHYLGRFSSTHANLMKVLERKVRRRNEENTAPSAEQQEWMRAVADKCVGYGYVDDMVYARQRLASLLRKGKPLRTIAQDLRYKGVPSDVADTVLAEIQNGTEQDLNLSAAAAYVKRRRFGPFRRSDKQGDKKVEKEKAAMMRAGFAYSIVMQVLNATEEELVNLLP